MESNKYFLCISNAITNGDGRDCPAEARVCVTPYHAALEKRVNEASFVVVFRVDSTWGTESATDVCKMAKTIPR